ncbi:MAG: diguanylate cyclase [Halioglobus sp.]|nr:diguanylate cyclase [Halioglobus sp.]
MSNSQTQPGQLPAILVLDNALRLRGQLSPMLDGSLELDNLSLEDPHDGDAEIAVDVGAYASLSLPPEVAADSDPDGVRVYIAHVYRECITLKFADADADNARRLRELMGTHASGSAAPAAAPQAPASPSAGQAPAPQPANAGEKPATGTDKPRSDTHSPAAPVSAEYAKLLEELQARGVEHLATTLKPFLLHLTDHLLELSPRMRQKKDGENLHYDSAIIIRHAAGGIAQQFLDQVNGYFGDLTPERADDQLWQYNIGSPDELDLVDLQEFEDFLLIDRMVNAGEDQHRITLEALTVRMAQLVGVDPNTLRNPLHVRQLCRAFQGALLGAEVPAEVLSHIFEFFSGQFIAQLDGYYGELNALLARHDVLPQVEEEIRTKGSLLKRRGEVDRPAPRPRREPPPAAPQPAAPPGGAGSTGAGGASPATHRAASELDQLHQHLGEQLTGAMGRFTPASLYKSVVDALNFKREAEGLLEEGTLDSGAALSSTWEGATVASSEVDQSRLADAQAIARALGALQRDQRAREEVQASDSLRAYLASNRDNIGDLKDSSGLTAESLNQLDMVDNLFGTIKSQLDVTRELKPALSSLQIPLAKLALMDPRFFVDHSHAARAVVDKLSQLATSANFPNKALEGRINAIVDEIIDDYETDATVFDTALEKIDRLVAQQERALSRNIERVVRTQEGQEKLAQARREVGRLIREKLPEQTAPKVLVELIESGWRDALVLTHVKEGANSATWLEQLNNLEVLNAWLKERQSGADDDDSVQSGLEAEPLLDLIGTQIATALPTNMAHEAVLDKLRDIMAGTMDVETIEVGDSLSDGEPDPDQVRARIEDLPRLRRWVKRVEQLEKDDWLTYRDSSGKKKRMQLAWISPNRDRYIFVNERGQKIADLSAIRLARQLSRGVQPPAPADKLSVVDQSMYQTLEHVQKTLSFARNHDSLTRLINRETFLDQMQRALRHARHKRSQHAVLYLNIDQFNLVNEVYDRISGDQVLLEFARLLAQLHGKKISSARIKGDEFAILLIDRSIESAEEFAEKVRGDIEASSMDIDGENVTFTVSIGVAAIVEHSPGVEQRLEAARDAMQMAKQAGRNRVARFEEDHNDVSQYRSEKTRTRQNLEEALATDRFVLRAQPIVQSAVSGESTSLHYELLLGLKNKDGSLSSPEEFIQSAERYGFMILVDRWVVREAFTWISQLMDAQKVVPNLAINLSGASVTDDGFLDYLLEQISEFGVGTSRLCFEITETGTISNLVKAADFVRAFRNIGCKFSIDDFGTGLASHNYLRELPVDYVKIDGSFVTGIHKNRNDYAMARSINDLAHFLGQETIAESVENDEIVAKLQEIGVDYLQGWGVGRPKLLTEVTDDLSSIEK